MKGLFFHILYLTIFLTSALTSYAQHDGIDKSKSKSLKSQYQINSLKEQIDWLENTYGLHFLYEPKLLAGKPALDLPNHLDLPNILQKELAPLHLHLIKISEDTYAIIRKKGAGFIFGKVLDKSTTPLIGATIKIAQTEKGTITDLNGAYQLELPEGQYQFEVSYVGFKTLQQQININTGEKLHLDFQLSDFTTLEQIIVAGSRAAPTTMLEKTAPADVVEAKQIANTFQTDIGQALQYAVPSFHSTPQTISDGTDHVDPATLRGLGPDQFLVLINGKRRHSSAQVNINGTVGKGTVGTDLNAIPSAAIEKIEVLRDGAAAQYGSDAIAGVINLILKENTNFLDLNAQAGVSVHGDGEVFSFNSNHGFAVGRKGGFMNWTLDFRKKGHINRSQVYTGPVFGDHRDQYADSLALFFDQTGFDGQRVMSVGGAAILNSGIFFNGSFPIDDKIEIYNFGGFNYRRGDSGGFYRFPYQETRQSGLYEFGFSPKIKSDIIDRAVTIGIKAMRRGWEVDLSNSTGNNTLGFTVYDSNNASMGLLSPTTASAGGYAYTQNITNLDIQRKITQPFPLNIAFGGEFRLENYRQKSGEEASWQDFGSLTTGGQRKEAGFQLFPGFRPENAINKYRFNNGLYLDLESALNSRILLALAGRYELYSDFGGNFSWKLAGRYKVKSNFSLRGTMSTGFRAPSMPQIFSSSNSIQFINIGEELSGVHVAHFNNISPVTSQFGIMPLQAETSKNYSLGLATQIMDNLSLTLDAYLIKIRDRIVITGRFAAEDDIQFAQILDPIAVSRAQFFTNAIDTKTQGMDFSLNYRRALSKGILQIYCIGNFTQTKIKEDASGKKIIRTSDLLHNYQDILFNREEISRIEVAQPSNKLIIGIEFTHKKFHLLLRNTHFGQVQYIHPEDDDPKNWVLNTLNNRVSSRDQTFGGKWITDLNMSYHFSNKFTLSLGSNNIFNVFPDRHQHSANIGYGFFPYSRRVQQFGILGAFWFTQIKMKL